MNDDQVKENHAQSSPKKYIVLVIALILIGAFLYLLFSPKDVVKDVSPTADETMDQEKNSIVEKKPVVEETNPVEERTPADSMEEVVVEEVVKLPDLYVKSYSFDEDPKQNDELTLQVTIANKGEADAKNFSWEWRPTGDDVECDDTVSKLEVGATKSIECDYTYKKSETYDAIFTVDSGDDVDESNEDNNTYKKEVTPEEDKKADLYISEYSFDPVPEKGVQFTVRIGIKNKGTKSSGQFYWEWWPTAYNYACREKITELAPNSEKVVTCTYTYGGWSTYPTKAVADADKTVTEFDETNNTYTETVIPIH